MVKIKFKILSVLITVSILSLLLLTGPVKAFILGMVISDNLVDVGETITFTTSVEIESGELIPVDQLEFYIFGRKNLSCIFYPNGSFISGCEGISIQQLSSFNFGYGYGYNYHEGNLSYNLTLNTTGYLGGLYETEFKIISGGETFFKEGGSFMIEGIVPELKKCSVRARQGELTVNETTYQGNRNSFNFKIPLKGSADGGGYLISQHNRNRISYNFYTNKVLENTDEILIVWVSGDLKIDRGPDIEEDALIYLDKVNEKVNIFGDILYAQDMDITFISGC